MQPGTATTAGPNGPRECVRQVFGEEARPFFLFNGTGANSVALQAVTRSFHSILCAATAHIYVDECNAPARMTGCQLIAVATPDGKLTPDLLRPHLQHFGDCHHAQPGAVPIFRRLRSSVRSIRWRRCGLSPRSSTPTA